jgi:hypothetical protein
MVGSKIETIRGKAGWDAQEFLEGVIKRLKHKNSTLRFEILNEPQVFIQIKFKKVANYHDYIIKNISAITDKTLFFLLYFFFQLPFGATNFPWEQAKTEPSTNLGNNIIFDVHPYPPRSLTMEYYKVISSLIKKDSNVCWRVQCWN